MTAKKKIAQAAKPDPKPSDAMVENRNTLEEAWVNALRMVLRLLNRMDDGLAEKPIAPEHWERAFGNKDSMVTNLQKLVNVLGVIAAELLDKTPADQVMEHISDDDMDAIMRWLERETAKKVPR